MIIHLYVKKHRVTGLKYFGKTTKADPYSYCGSGVHWKRHIKAHGINAVETLNVWSFDNVEDCRIFAESFSYDNNIVDSKEWANLKPENGLDGGSPKTGKPLSDKHKANLSAALKGRKLSDEHKEKLSKSGKNRIRSEAHCQNLSKAKSGKPVPHLQTPESRKKLSDSLIGHKVSNNSRLKMSESKLGTKNPFHGRAHSEEAKRTISEKAKALAKGRFWIVNKDGGRKACYAIDDIRLLSGEFVRGTVWRDKP